MLGFSRTIKGILCSPEYAEVFPLYKLYNGKPFEVERESDWKIKNANVPKSNHIARTRSGSTTGERASFAIIFDDMTKGAEEANSETTHRGIYDKWNTEWWNRRDGMKCKFIFVGTQWCPEDILNRIIEDRNKISKLMHEGKTLTSSDVAKAIKCGKSKATSILNQLVSKGLISKIGNGRGTKYCRK